MTVRDGRDLLRQKLHEAHRAVDGQLAAAHRHDATAGTLTSLATALLAGAIAAGAFAMQQGVSSPPLLFLLVLALAQNVASLLLVVESFVGLRRHKELFNAPDPGALASSQPSGAAPIETHLRSLLASYVQYHDENRRVMGRSARARRRAVFLMASGLLTYVASVFFIVGGPIYG